MVQLRDGSFTEDPRLDRLQQFDPRSRNFPIRALVGDKKPRSYTWKVGLHLNQGNEGSCVGHAWAHEIAARPRVRPADSPLAWSLYRRAQEIDQWPGSDYSGTSVIAGAKATQEKGELKEYRWAGVGSQAVLEDLMLAVGYQGPAVLGVDWHRDMFDTDSEGFIHPTGGIAGGHAILCYAVSVKGGFFRLHNSWGPDNFGENGTCKITFEDMRFLLESGGEACIPVKR